MTRFRIALVVASFTTALPLLGCSDPADLSPVDSRPVHDPALTEKVAIDRFSDTFANLFKRSANPALPAPNTPFSFDDPNLPFHARGLGPQGEKVEYYNFDVMRLAPVKLYRILGADGDPVPGQLDIAKAIPGDVGSNDFVRVSTVKAPAGYQANSLASEDEVLASGYPITETTELRNIVMVPFGTTASLRYAKPPDSVQPELGGTRAGWCSGCASTRSRIWLSRRSGPFQPSRSS